MYFDLMLQSKIIIILVVCATATRQRCIIHSSDDIRTTTTNLNLKHPSQNHYCISTLDDKYSR
jgi:hypothetical protein